MPQYLVVDFVCILCADSVWCLLVADHVEQSPLLVGTFLAALATTHRGWLLYFIVYCPRLFIAVLSQVITLNNIDNCPTVCHPRSSIRSDMYRSVVLCIILWKRFQCPLSLLYPPLHTPVDCCIKFHPTSPDKIWPILLCCLVYYFHTSDHLNRLNHIDCYSTTIERLLGRMYCQWKA